MSRTCTSLNVQLEMSPIIEDIDSLTGLKAAKSLPVTQKPRQPEVRQGLLQHVRSL